MKTKKVYITTFALIIMMLICIKSDVSAASILDSKTEEAGIIISFQRQGGVS